MTVFHIAQTNPFVLPEDCGIRRLPTRPAELQDPTYDEKFDWLTVFFDIVDHGDSLKAVSPPLLNFFDEIYLNGNSLGSYTDGPISTHRFRRLQFTTIDKDLLVNGKLTFTDANGSVLGEITPSLPLLDEFEGKRVMHTHQKNQPLEWIIDWMTFYHRVHGANAFSLYDNGSTEYTIQELFEAVKTVEGYETITVVPWAFPFGPQGSPWVGPNVPWDSNFAQSGAMEHARQNLFAQAAGVINTDLDEFIAPLSELSVYEALEQEEDGALSFEGFWIVNNRENEDGTLPHAWQYYHHAHKLCPNVKWAMVPEKIDFETKRLHEHIIYNDLGIDEHKATHYKKSEDKRFIYGHYRALSTGWKRTDRLELMSIDNCVVNVGILNAMKLAFPDKVSDDLFQKLIRKAAMEKRAAEDAKSDKTPTRNALVSGVLEAEIGPYEWSKKKVWKKTCLVWETEDLVEGTVAFDFVVGAKELRFNLSVRDKDSLPALAKLLRGKKGLAVRKKANGQGFHVSSYGYSGKAEMVEKAKLMARDANEIIDKGEVLQSRMMIANAIMQADLAEHPWAKQFTWNDFCLVKETDSLLEGRVAFDFSILRNSVGLNVSVRNGKNLGKLERLLQSKKIDCNTPMRNGKGFVILKLGYSSYEELAVQVKAVVDAANAILSKPKGIAGLFDKR